MTDHPEESRLDEARFLQLVAMFQMAAMQQMGKLPNPASGEVERDLDQAKLSIDIVEMLQRKTEGNRSSTEDELLKKVLFELRMNYVDEVERAKKPESEAASGAEDNDTGEDQTSA